MRRPRAAPPPGHWPVWPMSRTGAGSWLGLGSFPVTCRCCPTALRGSPSSGSISARRLQTTTRWRSRRASCRSSAIAPSRSSTPTRWAWDTRCCANSAIATRGGWAPHPGQSDLRLLGRPVGVTPRALLRRRRVHLTRADGRANQVSREAISQWGQVMPKSFTRPRITPSAVLSILHGLRTSPDLTFRKLLTLGRIFG